MEKTIAIKGISNNHAILIHEINDETVTASLNTVGKQSTRKLYHTNKGVYFNFPNRQYLDEFMKVWSELCRKTQIWNFTLSIKIGLWIVIRFQKIY